jgi:hypothetical protein
MTFRNSNISEEISYRVIKEAARFVGKMIFKLEFKFKFKFFSTLRIQHVALHVKTRHIFASVCYI